jgi:hypothetical protein
LIILKTEDSSGEPSEHHSTEKLTAGGSARASLAEKQDRDLPSVPFLKDETVSGPAVNRPSDASAEAHAAEATGGKAGPSGHALPEEHAAEATGLKDLTKWQHLVGAVLAQRKAASKDEAHSAEGAFDRILCGKGQPGTVTCPAGKYRVGAWCNRYFQYALISHARA